MEAQPLLYQRPIKLTSQAKLFDWVDRSRSQHLKQVRHLTLQLTDVDLSLSLDPTQQNERAHSAWTMYEKELARFDTALRSLPGLTEITIVPPRIMHSQLLRGMYLSVLALIPRLHASLKLLVVHDEASVQDMVKALQALPKVIFKESHASRASDERITKKALSPHSRSPREKATKIKLEGEVW